jgi:hypothetical protein
MLITLNDVRQMGWCMQGVRDYCIAHNIDYNKLRTTGIDSTELSHDKMAQRIISFKYQCGIIDNSLKVTENKQNG